MTTIAALEAFRRRLLEQQHPRNRAMLLSVTTELSYCYCVAAKEAEGTNKVALLLKALELGYEPAVTLLLQPKVPTFKTTLPRFTFQMPWARTSLPQEKELPSIPNNLIAGLEAVVTAGDNDALKRALGNLTLCLADSIIDIEIYIDFLMTIKGIGRAIDLDRAEALYKKIPHDSTFKLLTAREGHYHYKEQWSDGESVDLQADYTRLEQAYETMYQEQAVLPSNMMEVFTSSMSMLAIETDMRYRAGMQSSNDVNPNARLDQYYSSHKDDREEMWFIYFQYAGMRQLIQAPMPELPYALKEGFHSSREDGLYGAFIYSVMQGHKAYLSADDDFYERMLQRAKAHSHLELYYHDCLPSYLAGIFKHKHFKLVLLSYLSEQFLFNTNAFDEAKTTAFQNLFESFFNVDQYSTDKFVKLMKRNHYRTMQVMVKLMIIANLNSSSTIPALVKQHLDPALQRAGYPKAVTFDSPLELVRADTMAFHEQERKVIHYINERKEKRLTPRTPENQMVRYHKDLTLLLLVYLLRYQQLDREKRDTVLECYPLYDSGAGQKDAVRLIGEISTTANIGLELPKRKLK